MVDLTDKELEYLNIGDRNFDWQKHLPPEKEHLPQDFSVYAVAKWCRRVPDEYEFSPYGYCNFMYVLKGYDLPIFESQIK